MKKSRRTGVEPLERRWLLSAPPVVQAINRAVPSGTDTSSQSVSFTVTFSGPVTGVDATDFQVVTDPGVTASPTVFVAPVSAAVYNVGVFGISGTGTLGLNLVDDGSIRDASNQRLASATGSFATQKTFGAGTYPRSVVTADVNGDGKSDIIAADGQGVAVVLLGNGDGTFGAQQTYACSTAPYGVAVADVNSDGKPDILVSNSGAASVSVLLGNGNGTFQAQATFAVGQIPDSLCTGDLNGDGKVDIVTANYTDNTVSVLLGNGDGTFQNQKSFATGGLPFSVTASDVTGDGKADVITANRGASGSISVLQGNGNGTLRAQNSFAAGASPSSVVATDLTGDGRAELVVADDSPGTGGQADVLLNLGGGSFGAARTFAAGAYPQQVVVADVSGDGTPDLVAVNSATGQVNVLFGNGAASFGAPQSFGVGSHPSGVAAADFNSDGRLDLVSANQAGSSVSVLVNNPNGSFAGQTYNVRAPGPLTVTLAGTLPQSIVPGIKTPFSTTVTITNNGPDPVNQTIIQGLFLSSDGVFDPSSVSLQSGSKTIRIKPGAHITYKLKVPSIPASTPVGDYSVVLNVNESGNVTTYGASAQTVSVQAAQVDFADSTLAAPTSARAGKPLPMTLNLNNGGNIKAIGSLPMHVYASTDGLLDDAQSLGTVNKKVNLKSRASSRVALRGVAAPSTPGSYFLIVTIDADGSFQNNTNPNVVLVTSAPVNVA